MGRRSTIKGYWRQQSATSTSSSRLTGAPVIAVVPSVINFSFDVALANTTLTGVWLPEGAIIHSVTLDGGGAGGMTPAVDIGVNTAVPDPDAIVNGQDPTAAANITNGAATAGVLLAPATPLSADAEITAGDDGTGTNATGTAVATIIFYMNDDGVAND